MTADRRVACLLMSIPLMMSTGCQAITTIFETGVWVGVILVVVILGVVAFVVSRFRRGGGPPRGTIAAVGGMLLVVAALTAAPRPDGQSPSPPKAAPAGADDQRRGGELALQEVVLQGCVAREDGWRPDARADAAGSTVVVPSRTADRGEMFVLRDARHMGVETADAARAERTDSPGPMHYRLLVRPGVSLGTFEGQQVEVRGRLRDVDDPDTATSGVDHRKSQVVQGGQMQAVGQTMSAGQGDRSGQNTATPEEQTQAASERERGDTPPTVTLTSVRMLAATCRADDR